MTNYALDTDMFSFFQAKHPIVVRRVLATPPDQLYVTDITVRERLDGWYKLFGSIKTADDEARIYERLTATVRIRASVRTLPYDVAAIARFKALQAMKLNVRPMDLRIAAVAMQQNVVLVTSNPRDFERIPCLTIEDWATNL